MTTPDNTAAETARASGAELELDRRIEVLLDETLADDPAPELGADFTARVMAARPFAPWETRRAIAWKAPALVGLGLAAASLAVFLAPMWRLGPLTALAVWVKLLAASVGQPAAQIAAAVPVLVDELPKLSARLASGPVLGIALLAALSVAALLAGLRWRFAAEGTRRGDR